MFARKVRCWIARHLEPAKTWTRRWFWVRERMAAPLTLDNRWEAFVTAGRILLEEQFTDCLPKCSCKCPILETVVGDLFTPGKNLFTSLGDGGAATRSKFT